MELTEIKPGIRFPVPWLKKALPTVEVALFFAKAYKLGPAEVGALLRLLFNTDLVRALTAEGAAHSSELQEYIVELGYQPQIVEGDIRFEDKVPAGEVLPELWKMAEVAVAKSIQDVADKLKDAIGLMPGKEGEMVFRSMMTVNARRPVIGDYRAAIHHAPQKPNLVILDVSGSMSEQTVRTIVEDVVALAYMANMHLAIVSNTATHWGPGEFSVESILDAAEYGGTYYEELAPLFERDWGTVVTIADYDSSRWAKRAFDSAKGRVDQVLDISIVNRPTFLSEVIGKVADDVRPLMVAENYYGL